MKKVVSLFIALCMILAVLPVASANVPFEDFLFEANRRIIYENEDNGSIKKATKIESGETVYGCFDLADGAPIPDYFDMDYYKFTLLKKSHVMIYSESELGEDDINITLRKNDDEIYSMGMPVVMGTGKTRCLLSCTLEAGVYYLLLNTLYDDSKYNGLKYMCYYESILADEKSEKELAPSDGGLANFKKQRVYPYKFYDVSPYDWFKDGVITAYELGLVNGVSDISFDPQGEITLAETIALAARLHKIYHYNSNEFQQGFTWYQVYVDYAIKNGIVKAGEFADYNAVATRAQFAGVLAKALPESALIAFNNVEYGAIPDVPRGSEYIDEIYLLYRAGVLTGNDEMGTFGPDTTIQRSAVATIVSRMAIANQRQSVTLLK